MVWSALQFEVSFQNDDDAERQASRAQTSDNDVTANASILSDREGLADCLKIINANVGRRIYLVFGLIVFFFFRN